jgi:hypothetical protein
MKRHRSLSLCLPFLLFLTFTGCSGEQYGKVSGKVTYKDKPVPGGTVIFANNDNTKVERVVIQPDGTYTSSKVPYGTLRVGVEPAAKSPATLMPKGGMMPKGVDNPNYKKQEGEYVDLPAMVRDPAKSNRTVNVAAPERTFDIDLK